MSIRLQIIVGSLVAAGGIIWASWSMTQNVGISNMMSLPPRGPLEVCAAGVIIWLIAKWRHSVKLR